MDELSERYLAALGIQRWVLREAPEHAARTGHAEAPGEPAPVSQAPVPEEPASPSPPEAGAAAPDLEGLRRRVAVCERCPELVANRSQTVFGVGDPNAELLVIGEAPGADEDRQGEPFVGRAGQLLTAMLQAIGLRRESVYIANILKCRPPNNRDPRPEEAASCAPYLQRQIALIRPRQILVVGRIAAQNLLATDMPLGKLRGRMHYYQGEDGAQIPVIVTYHPAYLLRSPAEKRKAWEDLKMVHRSLETPAR